MSWSKYFARRLFIKTLYTLFSKNVSKYNPKVLRKINILAFFLKKTQFYSCVGT